MRKKICFCTTVPGSIESFLLDLTGYLVNEDNYDVTFVCDTDESLFKYCSDHIHYCPVKMKRGIAFDGLRAIWQMYKLFRKEKFDIVQYATPNASLYACIAAKAAGIKTRIYEQWGVRYIDFKGIGRFLYRRLVKLMCDTATYIEVESESIREFSINDGLYKAEKSSVIWNGSACGVKLENYDIARKEEWRREYRNRYGIPDDAVVFGYCGRITRDKGLNELFAAFREISEVQNRKAYLMIIGRNDNAKTIDQEVFQWAKNFSKVVFTGFTSEVSRHYSALDVFCSLSYREGFGLVVIEAAGMGVPGIVTNVPGQKDTTIDNYTGILVPAHNVDKVVDAMNFYIDNPDKVTEYGRNSRIRVENDFDQKTLVGMQAARRDELIGRLK